MTNDGSRREFFRGLFGTAVTASMAQSVLAQRSSGEGIPTARLGRTNEQVSIICLGGWHIGAVEDKKEAHRIMHRAIDEGVNFFDNAWDYHDGGSEEVMGDALAADGYRKKVFLMTKNCERDYAGSKRNLEESLRRLKTDYIDLWQFHENNYDNDPDWVFRADGAIEAAVAARDAGKIRFIGFTGHKSPHILKRMLEMDFDWDTVQMPINVLDAHYRSFQTELLPELNRRNIGVIGMKALGGRGQFVSDLGLTAAQCRAYALSLPISTLVCGIQSQENLEQDLAIAREFEPMSETDRQALLESVTEEATDGRYEWFKSKQTYDSQYHRDQHGFQETG